MSSIFTQITQEAQKQRELLEKQPAQAVSKSDSSTPSGLAASSQIEEATKPLHDIHAAVTAQSDVVTSESDVTMTRGERGMGERVKRSKRTARGVASDNGLGKGSRIDLDKLRTVIEEIAAVKTSAYGFSVRMSEREQQDIEEFVLDTLRKQGIKGYEVSIAKLMRYAMRYMFRVHPHEFVTALRAALEVEETLSI